MTGPPVNVRPSRPNQPARLGQPPRKGDLPGRGKRYEEVVRLRAVTLTSALVLALVAVAPALATGYKGDVDYWGNFTVTIVNNQVTALQGHSSGVPCGDGSEIDPVTFTLTVTAVRHS